MIPLHTAEQARTTPHRTVAIYFSAIIAGTLWLFWPFFSWLMTTWHALFSDTFGYLVPVVSAWVVFSKRTQIRATPACHSPWGWAYFIPGLGLSLLSLWNGYALWACLALPLYLYGICLLIWGKERSRYLLFPIFLCLFLYPWDSLIESAVGFHLRRLSTYMAFGGLKAMGLDASLSGTFIYTGRFLIDVAPACSGLNMLNVLFFFGAIGAYLYQGKPQYRFVLWGSTVPLAVLLNMYRIVSVGLIGHFLNADRADLFYHDVSGLLFFGLAMLVLYGEAALLKRAEGTG